MSGTTPGAGDPEDGTGPLTPHEDLEQDWGPLVPTTPGGGDSEEESDLLTPEEDSENGWGTLIPVSE